MSFEAVEIQAALELLIQCANADVDRDATGSAKFFIELAQAGIEKNSGALPLINQAYIYRDIAKLWARIHNLVTKGDEIEAEEEISLALDKVEEITRKILNIPFDNSTDVQVQGTT